MRNFKYTHWLKIDSLNETLEWKNLQNYKDKYDCNMEVYYYNLNPFMGKVIKLECEQSYTDLDLDVNSLSDGSLQKLNSKPKNISPYNKSIEDFLRRFIKEVKNKQENINEALEKYRNGEISLDDYIKVCKENKSNKETSYSDYNYSHEVSFNSVLTFGDMKLIGEHKENEIYSLIEEYLKSSLEVGDIDTDIVGIQIIGSRTKGMAKENSDLDVLIEYNNDEYREDDLFNYFNDGDEPLEIDGIRVDFNPITASRSGTITEWLDRNYDYNKHEAEDSEGEEETEL